MSTRQSWLIRPQEGTVRCEKGEGRRSLLSLVRGSELVGAAKSARLSPIAVERYDETI